MVICVAQLKMWTGKDAENNNIDDQGMTVLLYKKLLNTCRSFCLEKRWLKRIWQVSLRSREAGRMWLHSSCFFQLKGWKAWNEHSEESFVLRLSCGTSLAAPGLFPGLFLTGSLHLLPPLALVPWPRIPYVCPGDSSWHSQHRKEQKYSNIYQWQAQPPGTDGIRSFHCTSISQDLDLKAKWPVCIEMNDQDNPKGTNKNTYVKAGTKVLLIFITFLSLLLS